jgi:hypothetical protein
MASSNCEGAAEVSPLEVPNAEERPCFGYQVEETPRQIVISVAKRASAAPARSRTLNGTAFAVMTLLIIPGLLLAGMWAGSLNQNPELGGVVAFPLLVALLLRRKRRRQPAPTETEIASIAINTQAIRINGMSYARAHVERWTIRGVETSTPEQPACRITFNFNHQQTTAVAGLPEPVARRILEAIQKALGAALEPCAS